MNSILKHLRIARIPNSQNSNKNVTAKVFLIMPQNLEVSIPCILSLEKWK